MKKIIFASLFMFCISLPAVALDPVSGNEPGLNQGGGAELVGDDPVSGYNWPEDDYMKSGMTYFSAANSTNMDGVTEGSVNANAWYRITAGYYLPANSATVTLCEKGYACPGGDYSVSSTAQGRNICAKNYYSDTTGASECQSCDGYFTDGTGATSLTDCKKTITFQKYSGSGTIEGMSGTADATKVCIKGQDCFFPDASGLRRDGWTFTGGWGSQPPCNNGYEANKPISSGSSFWACAVPTVYTIPMYSVGQEQIVDGDTTFTAGTGEIFYQYYENGLAGASIKKGVYKTRTESNGIVGVSDKLVAGSTITIPTWTGRTFRGYYTQSGCAGIQAFDGGGEVQTEWLENFDTYMSANGGNPYSGQNNMANHLYGCWSGLSCPAGTVYDGVYNNCLPCPIGHYCPGGNQAAQDCPANTYSDETGAVACKACDTANGYGNKAGVNDSESDCYKFITLKKNDGRGNLPKDTISSGVAPDEEDGKKRCEQGQKCLFPNTHDGVYILSEAGQTFTGGWGTDKECSGSNRQFDYPVSGPYYACKSVNQITINWTGVAASAGGTGNNGAKQTSVFYNGDVETPAAAMNPNATNQIFLGWKFVNPNPSSN